MNSARRLAKAFIGSNPLARVPWVIGLDPITKLLVFFLLLFSLNLVKASPALAEACSGDFTMDYCDSPVNASSYNSCTGIPTPYRCDFSSSQSLTNVRIYAMGNCSTGGAGAQYEGYRDGRHRWHDYFNVLNSNAGTTFTTTAVGYVDGNRCETEPDFTVTVNSTPSPTPTTTPARCPYESLQARFQVSLDDGFNYEGWTRNLNINQWQVDYVKAAAFFNRGDCPVGNSDCDNTGGSGYVQMDINGNYLGPPPNPADVGLQGLGIVNNIGSYTLTVRGTGSCSSLSNTATLNVLYCPYKEITVYSNRGRPCTKYNPNCAITDPWLPDITVNKKDVKEGRVLSGTTYNNGTGNQWAGPGNLDFTLTKPSGEVLSFADAPDPFNPYRYKIPPSWYTSGFYLNYPGMFTLNAKATNFGESCGDYPPESVGHINVLNCSYDSTVAGFQEVANPPKAWSSDLYVPYTGTTVKSGGFHDLLLSAIDPATDDIKIFTPAEQVILKIVEPSINFDQRADQGAPFTYTQSGNYTLYVTTPNLDTADPYDIEDGPGCDATAYLHVGTNRPPNSCEEKGNKINCCPFSLSPQSLWEGLVQVLVDVASHIGTNNSIIPFKFGVKMDKIEFTADRIQHANYLFGTVKKEADGTKKFDPGAVFFLSPPGELENEAQLGNDTAIIQKREERLSWDVSLDTDATPLKKGDIADIGPSVLGGEQLQKYLTRLPGDKNPTSSTGVPLLSYQCSDNNHGKDAPGLGKSGQNNQ